MSKIEWTGKTWNPLSGCSRKSTGCENCYAEVMTKRLALMGQEKYQGLLNEHGRFNGVVKFSESDLVKPLSVKKPETWFVNSMSDLFHENVADEWVDKVFAVMALCPQHTFQILTKRPDRMKEYFALNVGFPLPNVWLGTSTENQKTADERIPHLLETPAAVRFLSCEPLLGKIDLSAYLDKNSFSHDDGKASIYTPKISWVIAGGESGSRARPAHPEWVRLLRDQCVSAKVSFFFKQWGTFQPIDEPWKQDSPKPCAVNERWMNLDGGHSFHGDDVWRMRRASKKVSGRNLDGRVWDEMPAVN